MALKLTIEAGVSALVTLPLALLVLVSSAFTGVVRADQSWVAAWMVFTLGALRFVWCFSTDTDPSER
jgi:hypothetical protein